MAPVRLAVLGAGLIGKRHAAHIRAETETVLAAIVDPLPEARAYAGRLGARWFPDMAAMLAADKPDGIIVATPNTLHVEHGLAAIEAGVPVLVEKPLADTLGGAERLVAAAEAKGVPLAVGHHRRHNPMIANAREIIASGALGRLVAVHSFFWVLKPEGYFDVSWRREAGAGPILINLSHDVDLLRHLCGEIVAVQAVTSSMIRNFVPEETAAVTLRFANGALGTMSVSDTVVAPWSWEQTSGENPDYPETDQSCLHIAGTKGALAIPRLELWTNTGKPGWLEPLHAARLHTAKADPLPLQIRQFVRVIRGEEPPLVSGLEGVKTMRVIDAIARAAKSSETVRIAP